MTPEQRSTRARSASEKSWKVTPDRPGRTAAARAASGKRFLGLVDPDGTMPLADREAAARIAQRKHFAAMGRRSAEARRAGLA